MYTCYKFIYTIYQRIITHVYFYRHNGQLEDLAVVEHPIRIKVQMPNLLILLCVGGLR